MPIIFKNDRLEIVVQSHLLKAKNLLSSVKMKTDVFLLSPGLYTRNFQNWW